MSVALNIQTFLKNKIEDLKITRQDFIKGSGITPAGACGLINAVHVNLTLTSIIKIANFFNCSIDEVLGRKKFLINYNTQFLSAIAHDKIISNTKYNLSVELQKRNMNAVQLAKSCHIGKDTIFKYLNTANVKHHLSIKSLVAIADFLDISIDQLIGRVNN